jgi:hypothetical protein
MINISIEYIAGQPIGVMPDLKKILGWRFLFLRILWQLQRMSR